MFTMKMFHKDGTMSVSECESAYVPAPAKNDRSVQLHNERGLVCDVADYKRVIVENSHGRTVINLCYEKIRNAGRDALRCKHPGGFNHDIAYTE